MWVLFLRKVLNASLYQAIEDSTATGRSNEKIMEKAQIESSVETKRLLANITQNNNSAQLSESWSGMDRGMLFLTSLYVSWMLNTKPASMPVPVSDGTLKKIFSLIILFSECNFKCLITLILQLFSLISL